MLKLIQRAIAALVRHLELAALTAELRTLRTTPTAVPTRREAWVINRIIHLENAAK